MGLADNGLKAAESISVGDLPAEGSRIDTAGQGDGRGLPSSRRPESDPPLSSLPDGAGLPEQTGIHPE